LERAKIGEELLRAFKFFLLFLKISIKLNKTAALRENKEEMPEICRDTVSNRPRGPPCFLLARDPVGNVPIGSPLLFRYFPYCICCSVSIAKKVSSTLWAFPNTL
jgi:hypothetical protein